MSPALLSLLFNSALALLLVMTIAYCNRLSKKIRQLQDGRSELAEMIARFDKSTEKATLSLAELQSVSKKITEALQLKIDKANFLADDLAFLIEKSSKLATQLEQVQKQRPQEPQKTVPLFASKSAAESVPAAHEKPAPSRTGIEQLVAAGAPQQGTGPSVASIEAMLQKLAAAAPSKRPAASEPSPQPRTSAERELLSALKTGR